MKTGSLLVSLAVSGLALVATAVDGIWQPSELSSSYAWTTAKYWKDGAVPASASDTAAFDVTPGSGDPSADYRDKYPERVLWDLGSSSGSIDAISGVFGYWLTIHTRSGFTIANPDDFAGVWTFQRAYPYTLRATADHTPVLARFNLAGGSLLTVPDAGTSACISNAVGAGTLTKKGAGSLSVIEGAGEGMNVIVKAGELEVHGRSAAAVDVPAVCARAALHFDASDEGSLECNGDTVKVWKDVRGGDHPYAGLYTQGGYTHKLPRRVPNFAKGRTIVDFGAYAETHADADVSADSASLWWSYRPTDVCEAFIVEAQTSDGPTEAALFGDPSEKVFRRGANGELAVTTRENAALAKGTESGLDVRDGDFAINGNRVLPSEIVRGQELRVFSFRARRKGYAPMGAFAASYGAKFGGIRVGEAIVFTNFLSSAERQAVLAHLRAKWLPDDADGGYDVGAWQDQTGGGTLSVSDEESLSVREYATSASAFTKTGAGHLSIGRFCGGTVQDVNVSAGAFAYGNARRPSVAATFAPSPFRHYDASDESTVRCDGESSNVLSWLDADGDGTKTATRIEKTNHGSPKALGYPQLVRDASNGKSVLSFGPLTAQSAADLTSVGSLKFAASDAVGTVREGFLVFRRSAYNAEAFVLGTQSSGYPFFPNGYAMLRDQYAATALEGGEWTRDGEPFDPVDNSIVYSDWASEFHVIRFSATENVNVSAFFMDRGGSSSSLGGGFLGEVILYDRVLSPHERLDTEAYLLAKWKGVSHPAAKAASFDRVTLGATAAFAADDAVVVGELHLASDSFAKDGEGTIEVGKVVSDTGLRSVSVRTGTLAIGLAPEVTKPLFRFDALDTASLTYQTSESGGKVTTNVTDWADADRNGVTAHSYFDTDSKYNAKANPVLTTAEIAPGVVRPVLDFGSRGTSSAPSDTAAGMYMSTAFANVRDTIEVISRTAGSVFVQTARGSSDYHYHSGGTGGELLHTSYSKAEVRNGLIVVDGETVDYDAKLSDNVFHLIAFSPTGVTAVNTLASDRNVYQGGLKIAESVGFDKVLTPEERLYWQQHLAYKWFGEDVSPTLTNGTLNTISVGAGATLRPVAREPEDGMAFAALSAIEVGVSEAAGFGQVAFDGALSFEGAVNVVLKDEGLVSRLAPGTYPIVTAGALTADVTHWTVSADFESHRSLAVKQVGNDICLEVGKLGLTVIVK